jgi:hypothetical protein
MIELDGERFYSMADMTSAPGVKPKDVIGELDEYALFRFRGVAFFFGIPAGTDGFFSLSEYKDWKKDISPKGQDFHGRAFNSIAVDGENDRPSDGVWANYPNKIYPLLHPYLVNWGGDIIRMTSKPDFDPRDVRSRYLYEFFLEDLYFRASDAVHSFASRFLLTLPDSDERYAKPGRGKKALPPPPLIPSSAKRDADNLDPRERKTLLQIIRVLAEHGGLDLDQSFAAAGVVMRFADVHKIPAPKKVDTVARHLEAAAKIKKTL